jgi:hypothetical protein
LLERYQRNTEKQNSLSSKTNNRKQQRKAKDKLLQAINSIKFQKGKKEFEQLIKRARKQDRINKITKRRETKQLSTTGAN